jgi:hypothetical protein
MLKLILGLAVLVTAVALLVLYLTPVNYTEDIVSGTITINAGSYVYYKFTVPSSAFNIRVEGGVTSISGDYFKVYIIDSTNFFYWQNGLVVSTYYGSEYVTRLGLANALPPGGTYYLVIDNTFSKNSLTVIIQATLTYSQTRF